MRIGLTTFTEPNGIDSTAYINLTTMGFDKLEVLLFLPSAWEYCLQRGVSPESGLPLALDTYLLVDEYGYFLF